MTSIDCPCCGRPMGEVLDVKKYVSAISLSKCQRRALDALMSPMGTWVSGPALFDAVYGDDPDGGPLGGNQALNSIVRDLRRKLDGYGLVIVGTYGRHSFRSLQWRSEVSQRLSGSPLRLATDRGVALAGHH